MTIALWIFGVASLLLWAVTLWIAMSGDNVNARALSEILAVVPGTVAIGVSIVWCVLAAIHWII